MSALPVNNINNNVAVIAKHTKKLVANMDEDALDSVAKILLERVEHKRLFQIMSECGRTGNEILKILARKVLKREVTVFPLFPPKARWADPVRALLADDADFLKLEAHDVDKLIEIWRLLPLKIIDRHLIVSYTVACCADDDDDDDSSGDSYSRADWILTEFFSMFRRALVEVDVRTKLGEQRLRHAFDALSKMIDRGGVIGAQAEKRWFAEIGLTAALRSLCGGDSPLLRHDAGSRNQAAGLRLCTRGISSRIYDFLVILFHRILFPSNNNRNVHDDDGRRRKNLRKICSVVPLYSIDGRQMILEVLEKKQRQLDVKRGKSSPPSSSSYLERLYDKLGGKENFEYVAFGRLKVCGACGATNRQKFLLTCKRCEQDRMYPKRRYCDEKCQRAEWPKHREEHSKHTGKMKKNVTK